MRITKGAILLAAGTSSRYGSPKLLARLDSGMRVFEQTYRRLQPAVDSIMVVTRPEIQDTITGLTQNPLVFKEYREGMGATLAFAASHIPSDWCSALVCLGDMPFIRTETYQRIAETSSENNIVVPSYLGVKANPVAFGRDFFRELAELKGDKGAKTLLGLHQNSVIRLPLDDQSLLEDIDTPNDLKRLQQGKTR